MVLGQGGRVHQPLVDLNPDHGAGPIRRSPLVTVRSGDGMQPHGWPQMVLRTPHQVVPDMEPGGAYIPELWYSKFLPDGRIVPAGALGGSFGATATGGYVFLGVMATLVALGTGYAYMRMR